MYALLMQLLAATFFIFAVRSDSPAYLTTNTFSPVEYKSILDSTATRNVPFTRSVVRRTLPSGNFPSRDKLDLWLNQNKLSWDDAMAACQNWGGTLLQISTKDKEVEIAVNSILDDWKIQTWVGHRDGIPVEVESPLGFTFSVDKKCGLLDQLVSKPSAADCVVKLPSLCSRNALIREVNFDVPTADRFFALHGQGITESQGPSLCSSRGGKEAKIESPRDEYFASKAALKHPSGDAVICENHHEKLWSGRATFWLMRDASSYVDAQQRCRNEGGNLATIEDLDDQNIVDLLTRSISEDTWIGLSRKGLELEPWTWEDTKSFEFSNWEDNKTETPLSTCTWLSAIDRIAMGQSGSGLCSDVTMDLSSIYTWDALPLENRIFRYLVDNTPMVYYRRLRQNTQTDRSLDNLVTEWGSESNQPGVDFELFSTEFDALKRSNPWTSYDMTSSLGFPGKSGPNSESTNMKFWAKDCLTDPFRKTIEVCVLQESLCASVSSTTGKWRKGSCAQSKPFICRQDDFVDTIDIPESQKFETDRYVYWNSGVERVPNSAQEICAKKGMVPYMPKSPQDEVQIDRALMGLDIVSDYKTVQWLDGERVSHHRLESTSVLAGTIIYNATSNSWKRSNNATGRVICQKQRFGPSLQSSGDISKSDSLFLTGSFVQKYGQEIVVGDLEHGTVEPIVGGYMNNLRSENVDPPGLPLRATIAKSCTRFDIEPHRFYCEDGSGDEPTFFKSNQDDSLCMQKKFNSNEKYWELTMGACNTADESQRLYFTHDGELKFASNRGDCAEWDVTTKKIKIVPCNGKINQRFSMSGEFIHPASHPGLCLDFYFQSSKMVNLYSCRTSSNANQSWKRHTVDGKAYLGRDSCSIVNLGVELPESVARNDGECFEPSLNVPGQTYGPTSLTMHPTTGELFYSVQKYGTGKTLKFMDLSSNAAYVGSLIVQRPTPRSNQNRLIAGGSERSVLLETDLSTNLAKFGWINSMTFAPDGSFLFISDRDFRQISCMDLSKQTLYHVAGIGAKGVSGPFQNTRIDQLGMRSEIGVPQFIVASKTISGRLYLGTLLVNSQAQSKQRFSIIEINVSGCQFVNASYALNGRFTSSPLEGVETSTASFTSAITGMDISETETLYISQKGTRSLFYVDLSKPADSGKVKLANIKRTDPLNAMTNSMADAVHVTKEGDLLLSLVYGYQEQPIRRISPPYNLDDSSSIWDLELAQCKQDLDLPKFFVVLTAVEMYALRVKESSPGLENSIQVVRTCFMEYATVEVQAGRIFDGAALNILSEMKSIVDNTAVQQIVSAEGMSALSHLSVTMDWYVNWPNAEYFIRYPPPPPQVSYGLSAIDSSAVSSYKKAFNFSTSDGMAVKCSNAVKTATLCDCGSTFKASSTSAGSRFDCVSENDEAKLANLYSTIVYCAFGDQLKGEAASLSLPMLYYAKDCTSLETWKTNSQMTSLGLLETMQSLAVMVAPDLLVKRDSIDDQVGTATVRSEILAFSRDLEDARKQLVKDTSLMRRFGAVSISRPKSICERDGCAGSVQSLADDLKLQITSIEMSQQTSEISDKISAATDDLQSSISNLAEDMQNNMKELAGLMNSLSTKLSSQIANSFKVVAENFEESAKSQLAVFQERETQLKSKFTNSLRAIQGDVDGAEEVLKTMTESSQGLGPITQDFYECKKKQELAELARARAMAIFDCVAGAVKAVAEIGMFVLTGGASSAMKTIAQAGERGLKALKNAKNKIGKMFSKLKNPYRRQKKPRKAPVPEPKDKTDVKNSQTYDSLEKFLDVGPEVLDTCVEAVLGADIDTSSGDAFAISFFTSAFKIGETVGIPGMEGASQIMAGVAVLANYEGEKAKVEEKYKENMKNAKEAFGVLAQYTTAVSDFFTSLTMEFFQMISEQDVPPESVAETQSMAFWEIIERDIISFLETTDVYIDFSDALSSRRRRADELLLGISLDRSSVLDAEVLDTEENMHQKLRGRSLAVSPNPLGNVQNFRRALDDKEGCPDEKLKGYASNGISIFEEYKESLAKAMIYGRSMHSRLVSTFQDLRDLIIVKLQIEGEEKNIANWQAATAEFGNVKADNEDLNKFYSSMAIFKRKSPEMNGRRDPRAYLTMTRLQNDSFKTLCSSTWYSNLDSLSTCNFRSSRIFTLQAKNSNAQWENVKDVIKAIQSDFEKAQANSNDKRKDWFRIPVNTALEVRAQVGEGATKDTVFNAELLELPEIMNGCGSNIEVLSQTLVLEQTGLKYFPSVDEYTSSEVDIQLKRFGPFLKIDGSGNKHLFEIEEVSQPPGSRVRVFKESDPGFTNCGSPNYDVESFILRDSSSGKVKLCSELPVQSLDPLPLLGGFQLTLGETLAKYVRDGRSDIQLVLYAQLTTQGLSTTNCKANSFRSAGSTVPGSPDEDSAGLSAGVLTGVIIGSVVVLSGGVALVVKKLRERKRLNGGQVSMPSL